jgi:hypothetical protein
MCLLKTVVFCLISGQIFGTAIMPDFLIYNEDTLRIYSNPLESYLDNSDKCRPVEMPEFYGCSSTACWRGYVALWELRNDSIFLQKVLCCNDWNLKDAKQISLKRMFGGKVKNNEVFANWVSIEVINPYGELLKYIHQGYDSIYEFERGFEFEKGELVRINTYDNTRSKESIYSNSDTLLNFLYCNINWELVKYQKLLDKTRIIAIFRIGDDEKPQEIEIVRGINPIIDREAIRLIRQIPNWEVYYRRGKIIETQWTLPIYFDMEFYEKGYGG